MKLTKYQRKVAISAFNKQIAHFKYEVGEAKEQGCLKIKKGYKSEIKTLRKAKKAIKKA